MISGNGGCMRFLFDKKVIAQYNVLQKEAVKNDYINKTESGRR